MLVDSQYVHLDIVHVWFYLIISKSTKYFKGNTHKNLVLTLKMLVFTIALSRIAPVCNPTLQVIGLHRPCMEKAGVAINALQLYLTLKY